MSKRFVDYDSIGELSEDAITLIVQDDQTYRTTIDRIRRNYYDVSIFCPDEINPNMVIGYFVCVRDFRIIASEDTSRAYSAGTPDSTFVFLVYKNGSTIATLTFTSGINTGVFSFSADTYFVAGDIIKIIAPSNANTSLNDLTLTIAGRRQ
jgi:hypothetical protein